MPNKIQTIQVNNTKPNKLRVRSFEPDCLQLHCATTITIQ
ncbi:unnamed protein product [Coffea canephora]|uniref:Uncharacterized protein n=1 Tax=Coffea canephora TaxID=49390 RepID=A0A068TRA2_COFCA|nr:unnamed protein product [Coffea canephora]